MTPMEAWTNVSKRLADLDRKDGYTHEDLEAECLCFQALKEMEAKANAQSHCNHGPSYP